jgi:hypothetical protein
LRRAKSTDKGRLFYSSRPRRRRTQFFGDFFGFFGIKIKGKADLVRYHEYPHHTFVGWPDLDVCGYFIWRVDAHYPAFP